MGANDKGVVVVSEAITTRDHEREPGLIGMDLVRLGLERGGTAEETLHAITALLQTHGQGGPCWYGDPVVGYDNSFLIADANDTWMLETAGRHWVAKRTQGVAILSSSPSLTTDYDQSSYALTQYAQLKGWSEVTENVDFSAAFSHKSRLPSLRSQQHHKRLMQQLATLNGEYPHFALMQLLRKRKKTRPRKSSREDIALHAGGGSRKLQTTASMVARLSRRRQDFFFTGTSAPDLSVFKPVHFSLPLKAQPQDTDLSRYQENSLWWRHERFHRAVLLSSRLDEAYFKDRDQLERSMVADLAAHKGRQLISLRRQIQDNLLEWEDSWLEKSLTYKVPLLSIGSFARHWKRQNRRDGIDF
jgi:dipeptidase